MPWDWMAISQLSPPFGHVQPMGAGYAEIRAAVSPPSAREGVLGRSQPLSLAHQDPGGGSAIHFCTAAGVAAAVSSSLTAEGKRIVSNSAGSTRYGRSG